MRRERQKELPEIGRRVVTTTISEALAKQAEDNNLRWSDALAYGIMQLLKRDDLGQSNEQRIIKLENALKHYRTALFEANSKIELLEKIEAVRSKHKA